MEAEPRQMPRAENAPSLETTNLMQLALAEASGLDTAEWINRYSAGFRVLIDEEPALVADYILHPEETLGKIREGLQKQLH